MAGNINLKRKIDINGFPLDDSQVIDTMHSAIIDSNPRRCIKTWRNTVLVRNYFLYKEHEKWQKYSTFLHTWHPWSLIVGAEVSLKRDEKFIYIIYKLDLSMHIALITFFAILFGLFIGIAFYHGNTSVLSGLFAGLITIISVFGLFSLQLLLQILRHKSILDRGYYWIKNSL